MAQQNGQSEYEVYPGESQDSRGGVSPLLGKSIGITFLGLTDGTITWDGEQQQLHLLVQRLLG